MIRVSWWNRQKRPQAVRVESIELLPDGTLQAYRKGGFKLLWQLKPDAREGNVIIDWLVD